MVAAVAVGSSSGTVQILQGGVLSNLFNFTVNVPHITSVSPAAGSPGTTVTIPGTGFGATQGSGIVQLGTTSATVSTWSDTQIVALVAASSQNGIAQVTQNGVLSNAINFSVPSSGTATTVLLTPNLLSMVVGDTHTLQALNSSGAILQGLSWASSATTIASLSTDDPPIITALAPGHVIITAGDGSADLTIYLGPSLPAGTIQWSSPGDGSGVSSIVPAVPSSTGVADVFAFQQSGNVQAIRSDGTVAWTANAGSPANAALPDFQGGLTIQNLNSTPPTIQKLDGITGQPNPAYSYANPLHSLTGLTVVHTDGTIFTIDGDQLVGINPTTGQPVFSAAMEDSTSDSTPITECLTCGWHDVNAPNIYSLMIAGDGYVYVTYSYSIYSFVEDLNTGDDVIHQELHLRVLRATSSGSYTKIPVGDWTEDRWTANHGFVEFEKGVIPATPPSSYVAPLITNADQGVLLSWSSSSSAYCGYHSILDNSTSGCVAASNQNMLTPITNGSASPSIAQNLPGQNSPAQPVLQAQDGSFIGVVSVGSTSLMVDFDSSFNVKWSVPGNYGPMIATADGGVIAKTSDTGAATFDSNGNATGQMAGLQTYSWKGAYQLLGTTELVVQPRPAIAATFTATQGGNYTGKGTATVPHTFGLFWCGTGYGLQGYVAVAPNPCPQGNGDDIVWGYYPEASPTCLSNCGHDFIQEFSADHPDWVRIVEPQALRSFQAAFAKEAITVSLATSHYTCLGSACLLNAVPDQDFTAYVVGDYPFPEAGQKFSSNASKVYYFALMQGAQEALGRPDPDSSQWLIFSPSYPPPNPSAFFNALGTAIGNTAAHETGHYLETIQNIASNNNAGMPFIDCGEGNQGDKNRPLAVPCGSDNDNFVYGFYNSDGEPQYPNNPKSVGGMFFYGIPGGTPGVPVQTPIHWGPSDICWLQNYANPGSCPP